METDRDKKRETAILVLNMLKDEIKNSREKRNGWMSATVVEGLAERLEAALNEVINSSECFFPTVDCKFRFPQGVCCQPCVICARSSLEKEIEKRK